MKKQSITWSGDTINIVYGNGLKFDGDCAKLPSSIYQPCEAAKHGIGQKLGDAKSGGTAAQKHAEVLLIWAGLERGEWNRRGQVDTTEIVRRAYEIVAATLGKKAKEAEAWFEEYQNQTEEKQAEIRAKNFMKAAIAQARMEKNLPEKTDAEFNPNA